MSGETELRDLREQNTALRSEVAVLRVENAALREALDRVQGEVRQVQARVTELEQRKTPPPAFVKANTPPKAQKPRQRRAAQHNAGRSRSEPTRVVEHALEQCPDCGYRLRGSSVARTREVIELPPPQPVEITEHRLLKRWCPCCQTWQTPRIDWQAQGYVLGQGRLGVRVTALIAYLRTTARLPVRRVQEYLQTLHGLCLSVGEITGLLDRLRQATAPALAQLLAQARASPVVYADETGWREGGQHGYVWSVSTPGPDGVRYYYFDPSRAGEVAARLLETFRGVLVTDFYGGYNAVHGKHQRCWVHLLRDLHDLREEHPANPEVTMWAASVRRLYDHAQAILRRPRPTPLTPAQRTQLFEGFEERARQLGLRYAQVKAHPCQTLAKRLLRHHGELFQFVKTPGVSADNNLAERSIRPVVVLRKISGGTRSADGSQTRMALASFFGTWEAQGRNTLDACLALLRQPLSLPQL